MDCFSKVPLLQLTNWAKEVIKTNLAATKGKVEPVELLQNAKWNIIPTRLSHCLTRVG